MFRNFKRREMVHTHKINKQTINKFEIVVNDAMEIINSAVVMTSEVGSVPVVPSLVVPDTVVVDAPPLAVVSLTEFVDVCGVAVKVVPSLTSVPFIVVSMFVPSTTTHIIVFNHCQSHLTTFTYLWWL
jgi:hypothetical protein